MTKVREPLLRHLLGDLLRRLRKEQRRTLADVAAQAQVSMPYLSEVERGLKEASSEVLASICRALGLSVLDLLERAATEYALPVAEPAQVQELRAHTSIAPPISSGISSDMISSSGYGSVTLLAA